MSAPAWTPGPWFAGQDSAQASGEYEQWSIGLSPGGWGIRKDRSDPDEYMLVGGVCSQATAHLISAAPDLMEALEYARQTILDLKNSRWSEAEGSDEEWVCGIDAALAKARGEQS